MPIEHGESTFQEAGRRIELIHPSQCTKYNTSQDEVTFRWTLLIGQSCITLDITNGDVRGIQEVVYSHSQYGGGETEQLTCAKYVGMTDASGQEHEHVVALRRRSTPFPSRFIVRSGRFRVSCNILHPDLAENRLLKNVDNCKPWTNDRGVICAEFRNRE